MTKWYYGLFILVGLSALLSCEGIGALPLTDPDETFYALSAKEMIESGSVLTPAIFGEPQFEKPPLIYWLLIVVFKLFGVGTVAARLVPAAFGAAGVAATYLFVRRIAGEFEAFIAGAVLATSVFYVMLSRFLVTDLVFSVFIMLALYSFFRWHREGKGHLGSFGLWLGLAALTKGPLGAAIIGVALAIFFLVKRDLPGCLRFLSGRWWLVAALVALPWYFYETARYGSTFLYEFFIRSNLHRLIYAEHKELNLWYFYPAIIAGGFFPWSLHLFRVGKGRYTDPEARAFLFSWVAAVLLIAGAASSKLSGYILPLFPPVAILVGVGIGTVEESRLGRIAIGLATAALGAVCAAASQLIRGGIIGDIPGMRAGIFVIGIALIAAGGLFATRRTAAAVFASTLVTAVAAFSLVVAAPRLSRAYTNEDLPRVVAAAGYGKEPIVCDKKYIRGAAFYTGNPVVAIADVAEPFWSSHPVRVISTDGEIRSYFERKDRVLLVLTGKGKGRIDALFGLSRIQTVVSHSGDRYVIVSRAQPNK